MAMTGIDPPREVVSVSGVFKTHHTTMQALFRRYLHARSESRLALVQEILNRLQSYLEIEEEMLVEVVSRPGYLGLDQVGDAILEHEYLQTMFRQLLQSERDDGETWEEMFEVMLERMGVHFITEARDLLPVVDRSRDV